RAGGAGGHPVTAWQPVGLSQAASTRTAATKTTKGPPTRRASLGVGDPLASGTRLNRAKQITPAAAAAATRRLESLPMGVSNERSPPPPVAPARGPSLAGPDEAV